MTKDNEARNEEPYMDKCRALLRMSQSPDVALYVTALQELAEDLRQAAIDADANQAAKRLQYLDMAKGLEDAMDTIEGNVNMARDTLKRLSTAGTDGGEE